MPRLVTGLEGKQQVSASGQARVRTRQTLIIDKEEAQSMLDRSSVAVAKTVTAYPVSRMVNNLRTLNRDDPAAAKG
ncbi:hypothetical protein SAMN05216282_105127 [Cryobacterium psychrotolerans]|uniref:Uncharacterized protein n=1 Tax=Cryobacterium psychrotolerans TaxID=386301 RepID=A0A1G9BBH7_9MICO|nr:hypothetical protein SAMN05216282_105127 [Cryobacterium psychrotolerans]